MGPSGPPVMHLSVNRCFCVVLCLFFVLFWTGKGRSSIVKFQATIHSIFTSFYYYCYYYIVFVYSSHLVGVFRQPILLKQNIAIISNFSIAESYPWIPAVISSFKLPATFLCFPLSVSKYSTFWWTFIIISNSIGG